jgi:putative tryptophan/tyrosine transport system substrate-binding protein
LSRVGVLLKRDNPANVFLLKAMEDTAQALKIQLQSVEVRDPTDLDNAVAALVRAHAGAIAVQEEAMLIAQAAQIADLAKKHQLPTIGFVEYATAGGLLAFGVNFPDLWRRAAVFVDKILKGAKPADLPIEQATKFEVVINLKTAKALGLTIPPSLLLRTDQVIDP